MLHILYCGLAWCHRLPAEPRTVVLHRARKGFGFVLRGAKAMSPLMELQPSERCPALQYLDDVDQGGVADMAGLRKGDYLLAVSFEFAYIPLQLLEHVMRTSDVCLYVLGTFCCNCCRSVWCVPPMFPSMPKVPSAAAGIECVMCPSHVSFYAQGNFCCSWYRMCDVSLPCFPLCLGYLPLQPL
jgi:hypothetical protein